MSNPSATWLDACKEYKRRTGKWIVPKVGTSEHTDISKILYVMRHGEIKEQDPSPKPTRSTSGPLQPIETTPIVSVTPKTEPKPLTEEQRQYILQELADAEYARIAYEKQQKELYAAREERINEEIQRRKEAVTALKNEPVVYCMSTRRKRKDRMITGPVAKCYMTERIISFTS
jgi:hypothetical protein